MLIKSLRSFFNYLPLLIIVPFAIKTVANMEGSLVMVNFLVLFIGWIILNNFLSFLLDRYLKTKSWMTILITTLLLVVLYLDFNGIIGLQQALLPVVEFFLNSPFLSLLPFLLAIFVYFILYKLMIGYLYLEDFLEDKRVSEVKPLSLGIFNRFGEAGKIMELESKLIWRNKRSKSILYISLLFLLYPLIFLGNDATQFMWFKLFLGLFVTGAFALNYGQLMLSWNSPHFDLLLSRGFKIEHIFQAKYYLLTISCLVLFIFAMLYGFMDRSFWIIIPVMLLFNMGVSIFLYMLMASYNAKRIDPSKGAMFNYEGIGAEHFLIMIPLIFLPYFLYLPFALLGYENMGIAFIGFIGLLGFIFHQRLIQVATKLFHKNKYRISAAFRKKD